MDIGAAQARRYFATDSSNKKLGDRYCSVLPFINIRYAISCLYSQ
jgi:hypothetical protein